MRNDLIQFVQVEADLFRCHCCRLCQCVGGELVHLSAVLQHGVFPALRTCSDAVIIFCLTLRLHKGRLRQCTVGIGKEISIGGLARLIAATAGYRGNLAFNADKPDGTMRKLTDVSKLHSLGWKHRVELEEGVERIYRWYLSRMEAVGN